MDPADRLIVALDVPTAAAAFTLLDRMGPGVRWVKVGLELYLAEGRSVVERLTARGLHVFLDLKLHDIPNTVAAAVRVAGTTGAELLTVHAGGGPAMLQAAVDAAPQTLSLLAVTVLTSIDAHSLHSVGVADEPATQVIRLGELAAGSGVHGLVCSPAEIVALRQSAAQQARLVVPGIRSLTLPADDQRRTATADETIRAGADMLVVGRPLTRAAQPREAFEALLKEIYLAETARLQ